MSLLLLLACHGDAPTLLPVTPKAAASADWVLYGTAQGERAGNAVNPVGDLDHDGYADLGVGGPGWDTPAESAGHALVFRGATGGPVPTAAWSAEGGTENQQIGSAVAAAGDVDGDQVDDLLWAGNSLQDGEEVSAGVLHVTFGNDTLTGATWTATTSTFLDNAFGWAAAAGDVNDDGYADVACAAPIPGAAGLPGTVFVFLGGPGGPAATTAETADWALSGVAAEDLYGYSLLGLDADGDGYGDLLVGAAGDDTTDVDAGAVRLYRGSATGLSTTPDWTFTGVNRDDRAGRSLDAAGDVNGDGWVDLLVGGGQDGDPFRGHAWLFYGSASGFSTTADWEATATENRTDFGVVAGGGDFDADGYDDIAVGAPAVHTEKEQDIGEVYLWRGGPTGPGATPDLTLRGEGELSSFGQQVEFVGDVNGDGGDDLAVGAPGTIATLPAGAVYLWWGTPDATTGDDTGTTVTDDTGTTTGDDTGTTDSGPTDSGPVDSGDDSGEIVGPLEDTGKGADRDCGCATPGRAPAGAGLGVGLLALALGRRRR